MAALLLVTGYTISDGANYVVTTQSTLGTINPATLTIFATSDTKTYNGTTNSSQTPTYSGLVSAAGDTLGNLTQAFVSAHALGAGASTLTVTGYTLNDGNGGKDYTVTLNTHSGTINPDAFTYVVGSDNQFYGSAANLAADLPATIATGVNGENLAITYSSTTGDTATAPVGNYPITATLANGTGQASDYNVTLNNGILSVLPASLTITANNQTMVYGGTFPTPTASYSGFVNGDSPANLTAQPTLTTTATAGSNVGTYPIMVSGAVDGSYSISYVVGTFTITPAPLTIVVPSETYVYGSTPPLPTLTSLTISGFVNGQSASILAPTLVVTTAAKANSAAGSAFAVTVSAAAPNYTITYQYGVDTVLRATPTVSVTDAGGPYNGDAFAATAASITGVAGDGTLASLTTDAGTLSFTYYAVAADNSLTPLAGAR